MIFCFKCVSIYIKKKNEIVNKFLLADDKYMPEMHLKQPGFTYSVCGPFTKIKKRIQKFKETGDTSYIYKNELDKACFHYDMAYGDFKDLKRETASDNVLRDKAFNIAKNSKYDGYQRGLALSYTNFLTKSRKVAVLLIIKLNKIYNQLKNCTNQLLETLKKNSLFWI